MNRFVIAVERCSCGATFGASVPVTSTGTAAVEQARAALAEWRRGHRHTVRKAS